MARLMPPIGSHLSIAGGYHKAADRAGLLGFDCVQIFTKGNNQWRAKPLEPFDVAEFKASMLRHGISHPIAHNSYLINLASGNDELFDKSVQAMAVELERGAAFGIPHVVAHPGAHVGAGEDAGLERIVAGLDDVFDRTPDLTTTVALETTAGQGSCLGHQFDHLARIIKGVRKPDRLTVCLDTCHVFAAGYDITTSKGYKAMWQEFDSLIGLDRLSSMHLNDSKKPLGSRVDRHEHIGLGHIGDGAFARLMKDKKLRQVPMYLETEKADDEESGRPWDSINLDKLRELAK